MLLLVNMFYIKETRTVIRLRVIEVLTSVLEESMDLYEEVRLRHCPLHLLKFDAI